MSSENFISNAVFEREINNINVHMSKLNAIEVKSYLEQTMIDDRIKELMIVKEYMQSRLVV